MAVYPSLAPKWLQPPVASESSALADGAAAGGRCHSRAVEDSITQINELYHNVRAACRGRPPHAWPALDARNTAMLHAPTRQNRVQLFRDEEAITEGYLRSILHAQRFAIMFMLDFRPPLADHIANALLALAADPDKRAIVVVDELGSRVSQDAPVARTLQRLRDGGVVVVVNSFSSLKMEHTKALVTDRDFIVGSTCIRRDYAKGPKAAALEQAILTQGWATDTQLQALAQARAQESVAVKDHVIRMVGPVRIQAVVELLARLMAYGVDITPPNNRPASFREFWFDRVSPSTVPPDPRDKDLLPAKAVRLASARPRWWLSEPQQFARDLIAHAKRKVCLMTSYWIDWKTRDLVADAIDRGIDVQVAIPEGSERAIGDLTFAVTLSSLAARPKAKTHLRLYATPEQCPSVEREPGVGPNIHRKLALVDDRFLLLGSGNRDAAVGWLASDLEVVVDSEALAQAVLAGFAADTPEEARLSSKDLAARGALQALVTRPITRLVLQLLGMLEDSVTTSRHCHR